jgi:hypothetical protein
MISPRRMTSSSKQQGLCYCLSLAEIGVIRTVKNRESLVCSCFGRVVNELYGCNQGKDSFKRLMKIYPVEKRTIPCRLAVRVLYTRQKNDTRSEQSYHISTKYHVCQSKETSILALSHLNTAWPKKNARDKHA